MYLMFGRQVINGMLSYGSQTVQEQSTVIRTKFRRFPWRTYNKLN